MDIITSYPPYRFTAIVLVCLFLLGLSACASSLHHVENPSKRYYRKGYSILPPQETGWLVKEGSKDKIAFFKKGAVPKSSYVVIATSITQPHRFKSEKEFEEVMGKLHLSMEFRPKRNILLDKKVSLATGRKYCLKSYSKLKDFGKNGKGIGNGKYLFLENFGLVCLHPQDKSRLVNIVVSYRYPAGADDDDIEAKANAILAGIQFEPMQIN